MSLDRFYFFDIESGCIKNFSGVYVCFLYKALTWKMKHLYSFHLPELTYEIFGVYTCICIKCGHDIFVVTVIEVNPAVELV